MADRFHFDVLLLPSQLRPDLLAGRWAVVFDVLRFSTALVCAFESGADASYAVLELEEAMGLVRNGVAHLACGERGGKRPAGFHLGNSPLEFTREAVDRRVLAFTTTNGTRALKGCSGAEQIAAGCLRNLEGVAELLAARSRSALAVCAGTEGRLALEDALAAGALAERLSRKRPLEMGDGARLALAAWQAAKGNLVQALLGTDHARALLAQGFEGDVRFAAEENPSAPVPVWDSKRGLLVPHP
jgi:2-phosphosulfolactate phosphatase